MQESLTVMSIPVQASKTLTLGPFGICWTITQRG